MDSKLFYKYLFEHELPLRQKMNRYSHPEKILRYGAFVGSSIEHHKSLERTMVYARSYINSCATKGLSVPSGTVFFADELCGSKGRFDRLWHAPLGGLWGCIVHANTLTPHAVGLLPMAIGVACCEAIREDGVKDAEIRWVNDVIVENKKIAGFLTEVYSYNHEDFNIVGFGINVNNQQFPEQFSQNAISMSQLLGNAIDIEQFSYNYLAKIAWNMGLLYFDEEQRLSNQWDMSNSKEGLLLKRWKELSGTIGKRVVYGYDVQMKPLYEAIVVDISASGSLVLRLDDGLEIVENAGEIRYL